MQLIKLKRLKKNVFHKEIVSLIIYSNNYKIYKLTSMTMQLTSTIT